jgi:hypothetical protein
MDPFLAAVRLVDEVVRVVRYLRLTPTRAARAAEEGFSLDFMRRLEWDICRGSLLARLGRRDACGCLRVRAEYVLFDIDCPIHDPLGTALLGPMLEGDGDSDGPIGPVVS